MRVIVKGSQLHAEQAAQLRGIPAQFVHAARDSAVLEVPERALNAVVRWFCEPGPQAPYPAGTCLFYQCAASRRPVVSGRIR